MGKENLLMVAAHEAMLAANKDAGDLKSKIRAAMKATVQHWLVTDETERFKSGVLGVLASLGRESDDYARIESEYRVIDDMAANRVVNADTLPDEPVGLLSLWREVKDA